MNIYYPILQEINEKVITLDEIFNPYFPDHVKYRCKASRKVFNRIRSN